MNLEFFVSRGILTYRSHCQLAEDTAFCDSFTVEFDDQWKDLVKVVVLQNGKNSAQVLYTGKSPIPKQVCGRGDLYLRCYGYRQLGDSIAVLQTKPMVRPVRLLGASGEQAEGAQPVTPSLFEQVMAAAGKAEQAALKAERVCGNLLALQQAGAFQGAQGVPGQAATVAVERVCHGEVPMVENLGTSHNALLRFTLPYKLTEEEQERILGELEAVIDHILQLQEQLMGGESA